MKQKPSDGFTIVEILIVLGIAGLIFLLFLQAVPTLQRSSRNHQRKQDVSTILAAVSHWQLNNSGSFPPACGNLAGFVSCIGSPSLPNLPNGEALYYSKSRLTIYDPNIPGVLVLDPQTQSAAYALGTKVPVTNTSWVKVFNYEKCIANGQASPVGAQYGDIVALYALESGDRSYASQCQQI